MKYMDLTGKVAVITGSARGIGMESARLLGEAGAAVAIADVNIDQATSTASALAKDGIDAKPFVLDVSQEASVRAMIDAVIAAWNRLDILVNNAGILDLTSVPEMTVEKWDRMMAINLRGPQLCSQHAFPHLIKAGGGKIVNIASQAGQMGGVAAGVHYSATKGGIIALTKSYARYGAQFQVNVNCVAPGLMYTDMTKDRGDDPNSVPLGRLGTALDAAKAVLFLATSMSDYITGATVDVNGGFYIR